MRTAWAILKRSVKGFFADDATTLAAALAFYSVLSMAPLIVIVLALVGTVWSGEAAQDQLVDQVTGVVGESAASAIHVILEAASRPSIRGIAAAASAFTLALSASGVFGQLQHALNRTWDVETKPGGGVRGAVRKRLIAVGMLLAVAALLVASLAATTALNATVGPLRDQITLPGGALLWQILNIVVTLALFAAIFALLFYYLPDVKLGWHEALVGGLVTALLFTAGKEGLGLYLGRESVGSAYGAAGSLFVLLLWVYYSSLIFLFGAELTQAYSEHRGKPIVPDSHARFIRDRWRQSAEKASAAG